MLVMVARDGAFVIADFDQVVEARDDVVDVCRVAVAAAAEGREVCVQTA